MRFGDERVAVRAPYGCLSGLARLRTSGQGGPLLRPVYMLCRRFHHWPFCDDALSFRSLPALVNRVRTVQGRSMCRDLGATGPGQEATILPWAPPISFTPIGPLGQSLNTRWNLLRVWYPYGGDFRSVFRQRCKKVPSPFWGGGTSHINRRERFDQRLWSKIRCSLAKVSKPRLKSSRP